MSSMYQNFEVETSRKHRRKPGEYYSGFNKKTKSLSKIKKGYL